MTRPTSFFVEKTFFLSISPGTNITNIQYSYASTKKEIYHGAHGRTTESHGVLSRIIFLRAFPWFSPALRGKIFTVRRSKTHEHLIMYPFPADT
jgi:hypothetical protein